MGKIKNFIQFIKFILLGVSNTFISEFIYVVIVCLGGHYILATVIGFILSVLNAFYWGNKYVFREQREKSNQVWWQVLIKTYISYAGGMVLDLVLLFVWIDVLNIADYMGWIIGALNSIGLQNIDCYVVGEIIAKALNVVIITPINYVMNKYWAYKQK